MRREAAVPVFLRRRRDAAADFDASVIVEIVQHYFSDRPGAQAYGKGEFLFF